MKLIHFTKAHQEPNRDSKRLMLKARHHGTQLGSVHAPGLFDFSSFNVDAAFVGIAVGLEVYGLFNLHRLLGMALLAYLAVLVLDVVFGALAHFGTGALHEAKLLALIEPDEAKRVQLASTPLWHGALRLVGAMGIILLAVMKTVGLLMTAMTMGQPPAQMLFLVATYVICALIHLRSTGSFLAGLSAK